MRIVVAGCGYVGAEVARRCAGDGHEVLALRRSEAAPPTGTQAFRADLARPESLRGLPAVDAVIFSPTPDTRDDAGYARTYVQGARHLASHVATAVPDARWIHVSSTSVYEVDDGGWVDEDTETPGDGFRAARLLESEDVPRRAGLRATALRLGGIYGPGREGLIRRVRSGEARARPRYTNRIHRDDAAAAAVHLLHASDPPALRIGVDRDPVSEADVLDWVAERLGVAAPAREGDGPMRGKRCRSERLAADGFEFAWPGYREGYGALIASREEGE